MGPADITVVDRSDEPWACPGCGAGYNELCKPDCDYWLEMKSLSDESDEKGWHGDDDE